MPQDWRIEFYRIIALALAALFIGYLVGQVLLALLIAIALYLAYFYFQLNRLNRWLQSLAIDMESSTPESSGLWGQIFDGLYRLQAREKRGTQELKHILARAQKSVAALDIAAVLIDKRDDIEWWNQAAETLIGLRYPEDRGQKITNLVRIPQFADYFVAEKYGEVLTIPSPINTDALLEIQITLFGENEKLMIVRDITQMHKLELMRKDFVANVSHELRTPITVISGYLESLLENNHLIDPKWHKPLVQMHQQSKRVENIVRDLLTLSHLETRAISSDQSEINLCSLLEEIQKDSQPIFEDKDQSISLNCDAELSLAGDRSELYSAISNLVINAAKYTPNGGMIMLNCEKLKDSIVVSVTDNGIGIEPQHIPRLTERFYRVDVSRSSNTGGTGLGLAIVKHILMRHGATLEITSEPGKGSCFKCSFPIKPAGSFQPD